MRYTGTRNAALDVSSSAAIVGGLTPDGGLYVPKEIPSVSPDWIAGLGKMPYHERAFEVLRLFLTDFPGDELREATSAAYFGGRFLDNRPISLEKISEGEFALNLCRGPSCAFKDMALQLTPRLLTLAAKRELSGKNVLILVATSGDTGKAALEGFCNVPGVSIAVFYPDHGVSEMQRLQMATQEGGNVAVFGIKGNFDDAQTNVKRIFTDSEIVETLSQRGWVMSSANSINWGRLVPQIVYYLASYADLVAMGELGCGEPVNFVVPTGNFGNILAGYYAMKMGLPVNRLVCASNQNNVLTDFINTGVYDANRLFYNTLSPSMDILISSNLERLLFDLSGQDPDEVRGLMENLSKNRRYEVSPQLREAVSKRFYGCYVEDADCLKTIKSTFEKSGFLSDPHTAVALTAYSRYREDTGDRTPTVVLSTASPYKFPRAVLSAISGADQGDDEFSCIEKLYRATSCEPPLALAGLRAKKERFNRVIKPDEMKRTVLELV